MKKVNIILIILNLLLITLIIVKISNQKQNIEYKISDFDISFEDLRYELERELLYGEGKYSGFVNGVRVNMSEELTKDMALEDGLTVKDYSFNYKNNATKFFGTVVNDSDVKKGGYYANLILYDDTGAEVIKLPVYINEIAPKSEVSVRTSMIGDLSDIYRCEIKKVEEGELNE